MPSRAYVSSFSFKGQDQQKKVGTLSGGEPNRVHLAKMIRSAGNVLLLDRTIKKMTAEEFKAAPKAAKK